MGVYTYIKCTCLFCFAQYIKIQLHIQDNRITHVYPFLILYLLKPIIAIFDANKRVLSIVS